MARRHQTSRRRAAVATAAAALALVLTAPGASAARLLRSDAGGTQGGHPQHSSYGSYHGVAPDDGPTGDLLRGPMVTPGRAVPPVSTTDRANVGSPPVRGTLARIKGSFAQAEARREMSGFEGIEPENVAGAHAGEVLTSRVQSEIWVPGTTTYTGTMNANVVGGRMAAVAATRLGARAHAIAGGRPINSRYGSTPQTANIPMNAGFDLPHQYPVAVAGSAQTHTASVSGTGDKTGVIASTRLAQSIAKSG